MLQSIRYLLRPLVNQVANLVSRAEVLLADDGPKMQLLQLGVGVGETRDGCERVGDYGFTSVPLPGAEAVVLFPNGHRDHGLVVAVGDRRYRLAGLAPGEVALYTDEGDAIHLKRGRTIEVRAGAKVVVDAPLVELAQPAGDAALKGTAYATAEATFLTALSAYATAIKAVADPSNAATPALLSAISTFTSAASGALSTRVKVG